MSGDFEAKLVGDKISKVKFADKSISAETFLTGTYDSVVSIYILFIVCVVDHIIVHGIYYRHCQLCYTEILF